jgi:Cu2+-exporting ATPase
VIDETFYEVGYGLKVTLDKLELLVGSYRFMELEHIVVPTVIQTHIARCNAEGRSLVYVAVGGVLVGAIELDAALRPEALAIVNWLKQRGLELYIISGDQEAPTRRLAEELNMDGYFSNVLPEGKATLIQTLQADGKKVCFIGDGINDAIALRKANVSVSFRGATTVASDSAQIVLMDDNLEQLKLLFELAHAYDDNLAANYRQAVNRSLIAAAAVLVLPYKFVIVEGFWILTFVNGIRIATRSLLNPPKEEVVIASTGGVEKLARDPS